MNRATYIAFIDLFALMLCVMFLLPMKPDVAAADDSRIGEFWVEAQWPDGLLTDVDLWVQSPGDQPVGYSRVRGSFLSLFRDDLGTESTNARYETISGRGVIPDGEYIVNAHLYSDAAASAPVTVSIAVYYRTPILAKITIWKGDIVLPVKGAEITAVRFKMQNGALLPGSIHFSQKYLRALGAVP